MPWAGFHNQGSIHSVTHIMIATQILNDSLCCSYKYNWCLCRFIGTLYILLLTFLINLSEICIILHEIFWIKLKPDLMIMKSSPVHTWPLLLLCSRSLTRDLSSISLTLIDWFLAENKSIKCRCSTTFGNHTNHCSFEQNKINFKNLMRKNPQH